MKSRSLGVLICEFELWVIQNKHFIPNLALCCVKDTWLKDLTIWPGKFCWWTFFVFLICLASIFFKSSSSSPSLFFFLFKCPGPTHYCAENIIICRITHTNQNLNITTLWIDTVSLPLLHVVPNHETNVCWPSQKPLQTASLQQDDCY